MTAEEKIAAIRQYLKDHEWLDGYTDEEASGAWHVMSEIEEIINRD